MLYLYCPDCRATWGTWMDADRFDAIARSLTTPRSRRSLTRLLGGLGVAGILSVSGATETLAALRKAGAPCTRGRQCKTGKCIGIQGHKTCSCSRRYDCPAASQCLHGGCFRSESCGAACTNTPLCGAGVHQDGCFCSQTASGVPVCYANEVYCSFEVCDADGDCPTGRACVDVSCAGCGAGVTAVCLFPCPVS
jgi:hypothetical protein